MKVFVFGEAMLEFHSRGGAGLRYGGDTLNTAVHMARRGCDVAYVTAVGRDPISDALVAAWQAENIDTSHVHRHQDRSPGIYAIHLDDAGERSFLYWRERSAAREMFSLPGMAQSLEQAQASALVYFSLITLAVIGDSGRRTLLDLAAKRKSKGFPVAYDSNYRPSLGETPQAAWAVSMAAVRTATIGLPTNVDEVALAGEEQSSPDIAAQWREAGCTEVIVKAGSDGCFYAGPGQTFWQAATKTDVVDSSGAGDAFNAGYLDARLRGADVVTAIGAGQAVARETLQHLGALRHAPLEQHGSAR
jgi:2-dehydro-3-deoxygluconokinase